MPGLIIFKPMIYKRLTILLSLCCVCALPAAGVQSVRFSQAQSYREQGKYEKALEEYRAILLADPDNAQAYLGAADARYALKGYDGALKNYQLALRKDPKLWAAVAGSAACYEALGQKEKAVAEWRRMADQGPKDQRAKAQGKIESLLGKGTGKTAASEEKKSAEEAAPVAKANANGSKFQYDGPLFAKAQSLYQAGDFRKSLDMWKRVLDGQPGNPGALYFAGVCRYNLGEYDKAVYNLQRSYAYPEKGNNAHYYLGRIYEKQKQNAKAREHYQKYLKTSTSAAGKAEVEKRLAALGQDPKPVQAKPAEPELPSKESCNLADAKRAKDSLAAALKAKEPKPLTVGPEKLVALSSGKSFAFASPGETGGSELQKALSLIEKKSFNQAIDALKQVRQNFPGTPNAAAAAYNLASLYRFLGLGDKVEALAASALQEGLPEPYQSALRYQLAISLKDRQDYASSLEALDAVNTDQALGPTAGQKLALSSDISSKYKPGKEAPEYLRRAIAAETDPSKKADRRLELASLLLQLQDRAGAIQVYKDMLDSCAPGVQKQCRTAVFTLGDMSYQARNWPMASEYYQKAVDLYADKENTPWAKYQLGNIYRQQKRYSDAVRTYDQVVKEFPGSYWADQAKWNREDVIWQEKNQKILGGR